MAAQEDQEDRQQRRAPRLGLKLNPNEADALAQIGWRPGATEGLDLSAERVVARVVTVYRKRALVTQGGEPFWATIRGSLFYRARSPLDLPVTGDWCAIAFQGAAASRSASLVAIAPRTSALTRRAAGEGRGRAQLIAANIDIVFIVTSLNAEFSPARTQRYLSIAQSSGAQAHVLLNKSDLVSPELAVLRRAEVEALSEGAPVEIVSAAARGGLAPVARAIRGGERPSCVFVGSSGVGKSTLINALLGRAVQSTGAVRESDDKGRHTTTTRGLFPMPGGGVLIDTPGMREIGLWAEREDAFASVEEIAAGCRFRDCAHQSEADCAVKDAVARGEIDAARIALWRDFVAERRALKRRR